MILIPTVIWNHLSEDEDGIYDTGSVPYPNIRIFGNFAACHEAIFTIRSNTAMYLRSAM